ncbi:MAG: tetratricopeptide repeat protein [Xanthomonadales bacterium]|nr:tetratricopeptide repeat protein [Xanthomonadales bacterium]
MCPELRRAPAFLALLLLAACATTPPPKPVAKAAPPARDWVAEIRAEARKLPSHIEVIPLQEAAVADLRAKAQAAEAAKRFDEAEATLHAALAIVPEDPALWQWRAEIALAEHRFADAIAHAQKSEAIGPKLGDLCVRNWLTVAAARQEAKDSAGAAAARTRAAACPVPAPIRM